MLKADHIRKNFGTRIALDNVSLALEPGHIFGLLGTNGAGIKHKHKTEGGGNSRRFFLVFRKVFSKSCRKLGLKKEMLVMKKVVSFILLLVSFFSFCFSAYAEEEFSFRNGITFGMTMEQVISAEGSQPDDKDENNLLYTGQKSAGKCATILYRFVNNALYGIGVIFKETHTNDNLYIEDFESVDEALTEKYGEPSVDKVYQWKNNLLKNDPDSYGLAVSAGHLMIGSKWDFEKYTIGHILQGDNFDISHNILYQDSSYQKAVDTSGV